jgi:hypothetical protein
MSEVPPQVIAVAKERARIRDYEPDGNEYDAVFVPKDDEMNSPDEDRDLWYVYFYPEFMKRAAINFYLVVVDPCTLNVVREG